MCKLMWRDHETGSVAFVELADGKMHQLSADGPSKYCESWTAEASLLDADFRQLQFSGLLNGGATRETAKDAALIALSKIASI